jgi:hypothetical protein
MIKALEIAIERIKTLPPEQQALAARILDEIVDEDARRFVVPDTHRKAILAALEQLQRGERAPAAAVQDVLRRPWA